MIVIAHTVDPSAPLPSGLQRYVFELSNYMTRKGIDVTLLGQLRVHSDKIKRANLPSKSDKLSFIPIANARNPFYIYLLKLTFTILFLKKQIPRSAIIHTCRLDYMLPFILLYPHNPKVLTSDEPLHTLRLEMKDSILYKFIAIVYLSVEMWCLRWKIDRLITDVRTAKEYYEKRYPWIKRKLHVMPTSCVELTKFRPMYKMQLKKKFGLDNSKVVMFLGIPRKVKNLDFLIRSFAIVKKRVPNAKLVIVGKGDYEYESSLKQLSQKLELDDSIVFTGGVHPDKVPEVLNCADVFSLCSITEGSPTVVKEAIACGVPVVTTDVGDVRQVTRNDLVGNVVDKDELKFANALVRFITLNEKERKRVEEECVKISMEFSPEHVFKKVLDVYKSLVN